MSQLGYTQGLGSEIKTDQGGTTGAHMQMIKLTEGIVGSENLLPSTVAYGVLVEVSRVDAAVSIAGTVPVSIAAAVPVTIAATVPVSGSVSLSGTSTVAGTVTANQGGANSDANAWPVRISNGTSELHLTQIGSAYAADVNIAGATNLPGVQADKSNFTEGVGLNEVVAGVYNDAPISAPGANQAAALRITPQRGLHVNLRDQAGDEIGTVADPLRIDPVGTTTQPISGTVSSQLHDAAGNPFSAANPLPVQPQPYTANFWRSTVSYSASQTAQAVHTPVSGKTSYVMGFILTPTAAGAQFILYDNTDSATTELYNGQPPLSGAVVAFPVPVPLSAINNILRYSTGASAAGTLVAWGYDQ